MISRNHKKETNWHGCEFLSATFSYVDIAQTNKELNVIWVITLSPEDGKLKRDKGFE